MFRFVRVVSVVLGMLVTSTLTARAAERPAPAAGPLCPEGREVPAEQLGSTVIPRSACDLRGRIISDHGVSATVPPAGEAVYVGGTGPSFGQELAVETARDGTIHLRFVGPGGSGDEATEGVTAAGDPDPCFDDANSSFAQESDTHQWRYNHASTDSSVGSLVAEGAIRRGAFNITNAYNNCGQGFGNSQYGASESYNGSTSRRADVDNGTNNCNARDQANVRDFGDLGSGVLALTCTWYVLVSYEIQETDIRFNTDFSWDALPEPCSTEYDVEAVATHEWGHAFGQSHVSESGHGLLTMSTASEGPCQDSERTLGRGDFLGLVNKY